jgi:copper resistance protein B
MLRLTLAAAPLALAAAPAQAQRLAYVLPEPVAPSTEQQPAPQPEAQPDATSSHGPQLHYALLDRLEWTPEGDAYGWDFSALAGGGTDRVYFGSSGDGTFAGRLEYLELDLFYSRNVGGDWDLNAGLRYDILPDPSRFHAALGAQYDDGKLWFGGWAYASHRGELSARLAAYYNLKVTGRLVVQPSFELNAYGQDIAVLGVGRGLAYAEAGIRIRYEVVDHFAPYVGFSWERSLGRTARIARAAGDGVETSNLVVGVRSEF